MGIKTRHKQDIQNLIDSWLASGDVSPLTAYLIDNSNLPGPRGNLELAWAFGNVIGERAREAGRTMWDLCLNLASISAEQAPVNDPREFLPFCGVMGLSALAAGQPSELEKMLELLRKLARDSRWRMREAVPMGLQRLMAEHAEKVLPHLEIWAAGADPLEMRAAAAAVADPPLLKQEAIKNAGISLHRIIFNNLLDFKDRKSEPFKAFRKGLGYTLSVIVQAAPEQGFQIMEEMAGLDDKDVRWILKQNLSKNRLVKYFPDRVEHIRRLLE